MKEIRKLCIFLIISFGTAYAIDFLIMPWAPPVTARSMILYQAALMTRMFTPLLGVIITLSASRSPILQNLKNYGARIGNSPIRWFFTALAVPPLLYVIGVFYALLTGLPVQNPVITLQKQFAGFPSIEPVILLAIIILSSLFTGATLNAVFAFGEEIGWRGLMLEELLQRMNWLKAAAIIGVAWSLWHAPLIFLYGYNYPMNRELGILLFTVICVLWSCILSILKIRSRSIIPPSVMHGTLNAFPVIMLTVVPVDRIIGLPLGFLSIASSATILFVMLLTERKFLA